MTREEQLRRVVLLCCHFTRNRAYYLAGWDGQTLRNQGSEFWATVNGNFMDTCVLEWCKMFADVNGEHYWSRIVCKPEEFEPALFNAISSTAGKFEAYRREMREYRDKFVAHLDHENIARIPHLDMAWAATRFYHDAVVHEVEARVFNGLPMDLEKYHDLMAGEGACMYHA